MWSAPSARAPWLFWQRRSRTGPGRWWSDQAPVRRGERPALGQGPGAW
jgi:hypothetical protein